MKLTMVLVSLLASNVALADSAAPAAAPPADAATSGPFVEINLAPFVFHGYSGFGGYHRGHFAVGAGIYSFKLPDFIRDSGFDGAAGLDIQSKLGIGVFGRYFLRENATGFYGAVQLGWERFGATSATMAGPESLVYETYINPYVGYVWKPMHNGLFLNPNFGVAVSTTTSGTMNVGGQSFKFKGYVPLLFFQVGYAF